MTLLINRIPAIPLRHSFLLSHMLVSGSKAILPGLSRPTLAYK